MKSEKHGTSAWLIHYHKDLKQLILITVIIKLAHIIITWMVFNSKETFKTIIKT
jgi:hypothetical protein